jgi:Enoyl-CoA hydratase/carnithine racemase
MLDELVRIVSRSNKNKAVIISGSGKVFSAGADLDEVKKNGLATSPKWELLSDTIHRLPCMTIAALNGTVDGGAMGMVLACDIRIS